MALSRKVRQSGPIHASSKNFHWIALGVGLFATGLCGALILGQPVGAGLHVALDEDTLKSTMGPVPALTPVPDDQRSAQTRLLGGISGETFGAGERFVAVEDMLSDRKHPDIAPVLWDDLADTGCLTVTAQDGKIFSFRIAGIRPGAPASGKELPKVELAVDGCTQNGEPVAKAVIEPDARRLRKSAATGEHSL